MKEITVVTAFFDIGRDKFKAIPRDNSKYFNNFKFWARLQNNLIVYTSSEFEKEIYQIREEFGMKDKTKVIVIDDITNIEPMIYKRMIEVSKNKHFINFRFLPNATSNIPLYSYLMLLKSWFMSDAVNKNLTTDLVAWIDFGFNHGGDLYINPKDFAFEWKYEFTNKIHLFYYKELDEKPIFETVRRLNDSIMGCLIVVPQKLCGELWQLNKDAMITLNKVGLSDDDQLIQLMSYRENPSIFEIEESEWFLPIKTYGGSHLTTKDKKEYTGIRKFASSLRKGIRKKKLILRYSYMTYKNLSNK